MIKRKLMCTMIALLLSGFLASVYASGFYTQSLSIGGDDSENNDGGSSQTFKTQEIPSFSNNVTSEVPNTQNIQNYNEVNYYNPYYYSYPAQNYTYRIGVPYYTYGVPGYTVTQPAYSGNFSFDYSGHGFDFGFSSGRPLYTPNYRPPQPPLPPDNHHQPHKRPDFSNNPGPPNNNYGNDGVNNHNNHFQGGRH